MFTSILRSSSLLLLASCSHQAVDIPLEWSTPLETCQVVGPFKWWEAFHDDLLRSLVECRCSKGEIIKGYIELRSLQGQFLLMEKRVEALNCLYDRIVDLEEGGFIGQSDRDGIRLELDLLIVEKSYLELGVKKGLYRLSTLLGCSLCATADLLCEFQEVPAICQAVPIETPQEFVSRTGCKGVLEALERVEGALALIEHTQEKVCLMANLYNMKRENYQSIDQLTQRGLKDDRDLLRAYIEKLAQESAYLQAIGEHSLAYVELYQALN